MIKITGMEITGMKAIKIAMQYKAVLHKYADPTEEARSGLTIEEAKGVILEDPSLIYVRADYYGSDNCLPESRSLYRLPTGELVKGLKEAKRRIALLACE